MFTMKHCACLHTNSIINFISQHHKNNKKSLAEWQTWDKMLICGQQNLSLAGPPTGWARPENFVKRLQKGSGLNFGGLGQAKLQALPDPFYRNVENSQCTYLFISMHNHEVTAKTSYQMFSH